MTAAFVLLVCWQPRSMRTTTTTTTTTTRRMKNRLCLTRAEEEGPAKHQAREKTSRRVSAFWGGSGSVHCRRRHRHRCHCQSWSHQQARQPLGRADPQRFDQSSRRKCAGASRRRRRRRRLTAQSCWRRHRPGGAGGSRVRCPVLSSSLHYRLAHLAAHSRSQAALPTAASSRSA